MKSAIQISAVAAVSLAMLLGGCGLANNAGEITLAAKEKIPRVTQKIDWPDIDSLTGSDLNAQIGAKGPDGEPLIKGIPASLKKGTLAHVQGLMSLAGDCQREIKGGITAPDPDDPAAVKAAANSPVKDITITITNCTGDARCDYVCGEFQGIQLAAQVELEILTEEQAKKLKEELSAANPEDAAEGIVQLRLQFFKLDLYQTDALDDKKVEITTPYIDSFDLLLNDAWGDIRNEDGLETVVMQGDDIQKINGDNGTRFEVDPASQFIASIKQRVVDGLATRFRIILRMRVLKPDLYEMQFDGAGVELDAQPEVVVSLLEAIGL